MELTKILKNEETLSAFLYGMLLSTSEFSCEEKEMLTEQCENFAADFESYGDESAYKDIQTLWSDFKGYCKNLLEGE